MGFVQRLFEHSEQSILVAKTREVAFVLDESLPRPSGRGAGLVDLAKEDLDLCGVEELQERIERLEAEAVRSRAALEKKRARRSDADALFSFKTP